MTSKGKIIIIEDKQEKEQLTQPKKKIQIIKSTTNAIVDKKHNEPEKKEENKEEKKVEVKEKDNSIKYKTSMRTNEKVKTNLKGDLQFVIKDVKTGNVKKIKVEKEQLNEKEYKVNPVIKYNLVQKQYD